MRKSLRLHHYAVLLAMGGCLLQLVGCVSGLAPVFISLGESALLSALFGGVVGSP